MSPARPLPFSAGDRPVLLCVGTQLDMLHARIVDAPAGDLNDRDTRAIPSGRSMVIRTGISRVLPVPGEWFELEVENAWRFGSTDFASGEVQRVWLDLDTVPMPGIVLEDTYEWTLDGWLEMHGLTLDDLEPVYEQVVANEFRRQVELEKVLPDPFSRLELEEDAIFEASEWRRMGNSERCEKLLSELTRQDLRCIDAQAHLGHLYLEGFWGMPDAERAQRHYRVGVDMAERALDPGDVTPKGLIFNRPYLRALHGLGLATWAIGDMEGAERLFLRLLWRDPSDGTGARFLIREVRDGVRYAESDL